MYKTNKSSDFLHSLFWKDTRNPIRNPIEKRLLSGNVPNWKKNCQKKNTERKVARLACSVSRDISEYAFKSMIIV